MHVREDISVYYLQQVHSSRRQQRIVPVAAVYVAVVQGLVGSEGPVIGRVRAAGLDVYVPEAFETLGEGEVIVQARDHAAYIYRHLPVFLVVDLAKPGHEYGIQRGLAGMWVVVRTVADDSVHQRGPVGDSGTYEAERRGLRIAPAAEIEPSAEPGSYRTVDYRQLPVLPVIDLASAYEHRRAGKHVAYLELVLVPETAEILLQGEQHLDRVLLAGIVRVILLRERLLAELCGSGRREKRRSRGDRKRGEQQREASRHQSCFSSSAFTKALTSSSELNLIVIVPLPEALLFREISLEKYLPTLSSMRR